QRRGKLLPNVIIVSCGGGIFLRGLPAALPIFRSPRKTEAAGRSPLRRPRRSPNLAYRRMRSPPVHPLGTPPLPHVSQIALTDTPQTRRPLALPDHDLARLDVDAADPLAGVDHTAFAHAVDTFAVELHDAGGAQRGDGLAVAAAELLQLEV